MVYLFRVKIMRAFLQISATAVVGVVIYNIRKTKVYRLKLGSVLPSAIQQLIQLCLDTSIFTGKQRKLLTSQDCQRKYISINKPGIFCQMPLKHPVIFNFLCINAVSSCATSLVSNLSNIYFSLLTYCPGKQVTRESVSSM